MRRVFDYDPATGKTQTFEYNADADTFTLHTAEDIEPLLEANQRGRTDAADNWRGDVHKVASLPLTVYHDLWERGIVSDDRAFRTWLNGPEGEVFRTRRGKV